MASTSALKFETKMDNKRVKAYTVSHDADTSIAITPGAGFTTPVGSYTSYTESAGVFTFVITNVASPAKSVIFFYGP